MQIAHEIRIISFKHPFAVYVTHKLKTYLPHEIDRPCISIEMYVSKLIFMKQITLILKILIFESLSDDK